MVNFQRIEVLIDVPDPTGIEEAKKLLARFKTSEALTAAVDGFLLDFMTLVFIVEAGHEEFEQPFRRMARLKLEKIKSLAGVPA